uniref:Uncharacterized protein n=1 Tax=Arundo donax TaxID=35708 RepID=A0A0A8ZQY9_ARUDO
MGQLNYLMNNMCNKTAYEPLNLTSNTRAVS